MKTFNVSKIALVAALSAGNVYAADSVTQALEESKASIDARYRVENVDEPNGKDGLASTLRTRIGVTTGEVSGFSAHADFEDVRIVGDGQQFNAAGTNSAPTRSIVADPEGTELNQAYAQYKFADTTAKFGRQRVILDNARFVGNVGWRQNEQTHDALTIVNQSIENLTVVYGHVTSVRGITFGSADVTANLLNIGLDKAGPGKLTAYAYLIELDEAVVGLGVKDDKLDTYGARYTGKVDAGDLGVLFAAEFAVQEANPIAAGIKSVDTEYSLIETGVKLKNGITAKVGVETLGSDNGAGAFQTPLATKHAFNGWADKFLGTPANGLVDTYLNVGGKVAGIKLAAVYHEFSADQGSNDFGSEIDLLAVKKFNKHYTAGLKFADFSEDNTTKLGDTQKIWLWGQAKF